MAKQAQNIWSQPLKFWWGPDPLDPTVIDATEIDFWAFLKLRQMEFGQNFFFREIDLFDFTTFLA